MTDITLQREIMDSDRLAERGRMVLDLNNQLLKANNELLKAQQENATLGARVAELENQLKSLTPETHDGTV